ncbi:glycosyltransferase family 2 protein [Flavisolibacter ginsenosidimutans]|uniref:Glycosyltransferase family 2 protein n=1 Tax=Flavisolibacter ginsenosidimutans TaxID=661481 RepID=A0A5B8UF07_9BACT|nr:glycosyltransferase family A protein [Flavisolibacter ginsenosidimutans]QEC54886.1 glycosyltransferase family 2 protein [Flavisolibacter ginsenosidimutans]
MPFVSVIVPNYNHGRYLGQRLESVFQQSFEDYEVIILDDASTDESKEIIERYRNHPKVSHIVYNTQNSGSTFRQWRRGLERSKGEWIWIAESDDYCTADLLNVLVKQGLSNEDVVLSYCQSNEVNENGEGWRNMTWFTDPVDKEHWRNDYCNEGRNEIQQYLWQLNAIPNASAVLFKRTAYYNASPAFESMKMCGDWFLWIELLRQGNIVFCATAHNFFRCHANSTRTHETERWKKRLEEEMLIAQHLISILPATDRPKLHARMNSLLRSYCSTFSGKEVVQFLRNPATYESPFPYAAFMRTFSVRSAYKIAKTLFARKKN